MSTFLETSLIFLSNIYSFFVINLNYNSEKKKMGGGGVQGQGEWQGSFAPLFREYSY